MSATVLPTAEEINPATFLPSSRSVAFTKQAWQAVGGYPEWLDYCEDLIFDLKMRAQFGPFAFAPQAVAHFRPRGSLRSFFKQYYLYARGDGKANLFFKRHLIRYGTYLVALPALLYGLVLGSLVMKLVCAVGLVIGFVVYMRTPYRRLGTLGKDLPATEKLRAAALVTVIRTVGDAAKMLGYPVGVWWRLENEAWHSQTIKLAVPRTVMRTTPRLACLGHFGLALREDNLQHKHRTNGERREHSSNFDVHSSFSCY